MYQYGGGALKPIPEQEDRHELPAALHVQLPRITRYELSAFDHKA